MEEKDLSQNPDLEPQETPQEQPDTPPEQTEATQEQPQEPAKESKTQKMAKAIVKDLVEFRKFDLIHKIYYLILSREAVRRLSVHTTSEDKPVKTEFKPFIDNYSKSTYTLIRNYFQKQNTAKINEEIDNLTKSFMISGRMASELYLEDVLFSQRGYEMLKLYMTTTFILPLIKKADSKALYADLKTIHINSKTREITSDFNNKQLTIISTLANSSLDLSYSAFALKKSSFTLNEYNRIDLELKEVDWTVEQVRTIPFSENSDGEHNPEEEGKVHIKIDKDYKEYYQEKIHQIVEKYLQTDLTPEQAKYFFVNIDLYLAYAAHLIKHEHPEVGSYIAMTLADECSRGFRQNLKPEDFVRVKSLKHLGSTLINKSLTVLYAVGNIIDQHDLKAVVAQFKEKFEFPSQHFMGVTDLTVYLKALDTLAKYGKTGLENFFNGLGKGKKD